MVKLIRTMTGNMTDQPTNRYTDHAPSMSLRQNKDAMDDIDDSHLLSEIAQTWRW